jgi:hypothetical protein
LKKLILTAGVVAAFAGGSALAEAAGRGKGRPDGVGPGAVAVPKSEKGKSKRCGKLRRVGLVVKGTFVSGDANGVTFKVTRANRHALKSGVVTAGEEFTATPTRADRIRYVNRTGPADAQPTDKVRVVGKVTKPKRRCSSDSFTPTVTVRKVMVIGPEPDDTEDPSAD